MTASLGSTYYFVIVGQGDHPLFQLDYSTKPAVTAETMIRDRRCLTQFIAHAALDRLDAIAFQNGSMYQKCIDSYENKFVSAFVSGSSSVRFLLVHESGRQVEENNLRHFFHEMYELYAKFALNPFYQHHTTIRCEAFDRKASLIAKMYLP